jgi:glycosyltransferase involved in cell wall biosynthesis
MLPKTIDKSKFIVIYNGIFIKSIKQNIKIKKVKNGKFIIGSTARVQKPKGVHILIKAFAQALFELNGYEKIELWLVGGIDDQEIYNLPRKLKIDKFVHFFRFQKNVLSFIDQFDIFVFPSLAEVFPLSIIEAMMLKKPIIATSIGGIPEQIKNNISGVLVPANNYKSLAEKIILLAKNPKMRLKLAENAHVQAISNFDIINITKNKIIPMYIKLLKPKK